MAARYEKRATGEELWKVVDVYTGRTVLLDGAPLDQMEEREADDTVDLLEAGELTPDISEAP